MIVQISAGECVIHKKCEFDIKIIILSAYFVDLILFKGGIGYSQKYNPWQWLTSSSAAEAMAVEVAKWPSLFGCDGIDLDIENGAGETQVFEEIVVTIS